jgi:ribonucleotide reductase beta subunit family protein with ferritin-like domain
MDRMERRLFRYLQKPSNLIKSGLINMSLTEARTHYKPFAYPWAYDFRKQIHWRPVEVPLGEDCREWVQKVTDHERYFPRPTRPIAICAYI